MLFAPARRRQNTFGVRPLHGSRDEMMSALYLQVSIISQALIFVTRSRGWCFAEMPGLLLCAAFVVAQIVSRVKLDRKETTRAMIHYHPCS